MYLYEIAKILRSKNSGPFQITLDILFDKPEDYSLVADSGVLTKERICSFYHLEPEDFVHLVFFPKALGIKITYNRKVSSGSARDRDVYGAQQHAPLGGIWIDDPAESLQTGESGEV